MDNIQIKQRLLDKERELLSEISLLGGEARDNDSMEVRDHAESASVGQVHSETLETASVLTGTLEEVRSALERLEDGSYGKCSVCGQSIEPARLEAVPWAMFCHHHQEEKDRRDQDARAAATRQAETLWGRKGIPKI